MSLIIIIGIVIFVLFLILGIILLSGKGAMMIAGYNTATPEQRAEYDEKKLTHITGILMISIAVFILSICCICDPTVSKLWIIPLIISIIVALISIKYMLSDYVKIDKSKNDKI